jgi:hypothetical protein
VGIKANRHINVPEYKVDEADETALRLFERNNLRSIFGAVQDKGQWRRRHNFELYKLYDKPVWSNT